jgi:signal transduction histidine kinase
VLATIRPLAAKQKVQVSEELPDGLPPALADPSRLKQILFNLVSNGIKFTREGGTVTVRACAVTGNGDRGSGAGQQQDEADGSDAATSVRFLEVLVTDTGIGIPLEHLDRVFEEFEQVPGVATVGREGTGLGLALVKRLVELHGGTVRLESTPGRGSTFAFTVPAAGA